jgi:beta-N-acetylglucosaminidase
MSTRKYILISIFAISFLLLPKDTLALSSSEYASRNICHNTYELASAHTDGSAVTVGCYSSYTDANNAMKNSGATDLIIFDSTNGNTKIVNANNALVDLTVNPNDLTYYYESANLNTRQYTYMYNKEGYSGVDAALLDVNYGTSAKVMLAGLSAWISTSAYEIVPLNWIKASSSYTITDTITHNYIYNVNSTSLSGSNTIGPKPTDLSNGTYYSYDTHYFYKDLLTMLQDYHNNTHDNAVNKEAYYNYYQFLSNHSKTNYSSVNINEYLANLYSSYTKPSRLYTSGTYFYNAQEKYGVNALLSLSLARNESGNGTSSIAYNKNNLFGLNAVDSNPYQAANWFPTVANNILEFASSWITDGYADPVDSRYFGPTYGNKYIGMNVKYASDPYWSETMASLYYSMDKALGLQDYNYYQEGLVNGPTNAYFSPTSSSSVAYTYPEKDDNVLIVDEVTNSEGTWYKLQSDKSITNGITSTNSTYNWSSYVYVKKDSITKINTPKNSYQDSSTIITYPDSTYTYDNYVTNANFTPKVAVTTNNVSYYYDSSLTAKTGSTLLKDKWIMVYAAAYDENNNLVSYLVTRDYKTDKKEWIPAGNFKFQTTGYGLVSVSPYNYYTWVNSTTTDTESTLVSGLYTNTYVPLLTSTNANSYTWYQVPISLTTYSNSYGWTIASCKDVNISLTMYNADSDNAKLNVNNKPIITANNKSIVQGSTINLLTAVTATDTEDGDLTAKVTYTGTVDTNTVGTYKITYSVNDSANATSTKEITITVTKNNEPTITATNQTIKEGTTFDPLNNVTATDTEDGDLTKNITITKNTLNTKEVGDYEITYSVTDSYNQTTTKTIEIIVVADQKPVITATNQTIVKNTIYDPLDNVTATDTEDGDLTKNLKVVSNTVDTSKVGTYKVNYSVTDSYNNTTTKEITITVVDKELITKDGSFYLNSLTWNSTTKKYTISGYLLINDVSNDTDDVTYNLILQDINTSKEYSIPVNKWTSDVPFDINSSWFKGEIDLSTIPSGDYNLYMSTIKNNYTSKVLVNNLFNKHIDRREEDSVNGYNFMVNLALTSKKITLNVRSGGLITTSTANTFRNMFNNYDNMQFVNNKLNIIGTSYDYGGTYNDPDNITRKLILENTSTYKTYTYDIGSSKNVSYQVTSSDNKDKSYAWYNANIDVANLPKGTYSMLVYTKTIDSENYGEIINIFGRINNTETIINGKTYKVTINKTRLNRIELVVE